jgi:hypothetical protein
MQQEELRKYNVGVIHQLHTLSVNVSDIRHIKIVSSRN